MLEDKIAKKFQATFFSQPISYETVVVFLLFLPLLSCFFFIFAATTDLVFRTRFLCVAFGAESINRHLSLYIPDSSEVFLVVFKLFLFSFARLIFL